MTFSSLRLDRPVTIGHYVELPDGFLEFEGTVAVPGVLEYTRTDGSVSREYVSDAVLRDPMWLETLSGSFLCFEHPPKLLTPKDASDYAAGTVRDARWEAPSDRFPKGRTIATFRAMRPDAIDGIRLGTHKQLSPGYRAAYNEKPGVSPEGEKYDRQQVGRVANHNALVRVARGGDECRMDGADSLVDVGVQKESSTMDEATIKQWIQEAIQAALAQLQGGGTAEQDPLKLLNDKVDALASRCDAMARKDGVADNTAGGAEVKPKMDGAAGDDGKPGAVADKEEKMDAADWMSLTGSAGKLGIAPEELKGLQPSQIKEMVFQRLMKAQGLTAPKMDGLQLAADRAGQNVGGGQGGEKKAPGKQSLFAQAGIKGKAAA